MKIYLIANPLIKSDIQRRVALFEDVFEQRTIDYEILNPNVFDELSFKKNQEYKILRLTSDVLSLKLDAFIRPKKDFDGFSYILRSVLDSTLDVSKLNFVKTVEFISKDLDLLDKQVEALGGFPLIVKENSNSNGVGVIKVDSKEGLRSKLDFLLANGFINLQLKEFFAHTSQLRVLIAFNKFIAAMEIDASKVDFRTNVQHARGLRATRLVKVRADILDSCLKYARLRGADLIGVDVLINKRDFRLIEGNSPCNFIAINCLTNGAVPGLIVDAMLAKQ